MQVPLEWYFTKTEANKYHVCATVCIGAPSQVFGVSLDDLQLFNPLHSCE